MEIATKKYLLFGLAICLLFLSINFIGFETTIYLESALKGTCDSLSDSAISDMCSHCNCNIHKIQCDFECKEECDDDSNIKSAENNRNKRNVPLPPTSKPFKDWHTTIECYRTPDYSDICIYEELCYDGENIYFISPLATNKTRLFETDVKWDPRFRFPKPFPPSETPRYLPIGTNSFMKNLYLIPSNLTQEKYLIFPNGTMWLAKPELEVLNPFFFAKDTLNLFEALMINETAPGVFPPMDYLAVLRKEIPPGWATEFLPAIIQDKTKVVVNSYFQDFNISADRLMCFPKAVIIGDKPRLFSGVYNSQRFKERLYSQLNLAPQELKGFNKTDLNYTPRVVVTKRLDKNPRYFCNLDELKNLLSHYRLNFTILDPFKAGTTLKSQIEIIREADVYITVHGGGVINSLFLPIHTSLIEIFPFGMKNKIYEYSTFVSGIHYQAVRSWIKAPPEFTKDIHKQDFFDQCQNITSLEHNDLYCVHWCKNSPTYIPMREMEMALIEAFDSLGYLLPIRAERMYYTDHKNEIPLNDWHYKGNWELIQ